MTRRGDDTVLVEVYPDRERLAVAIAMRLADAVRSALAERGHAQIVLTGGSMGSAFITHLSDLPGVDWARVDLWWGDERYLPAGHAERNDTQNTTAGLDRLPLVPLRVHRVPGPDETTSVEEAAGRYAASLREYGPDLFDVVVLGVGPDGHVASLFPGHPAATATDSPTVAVRSSPKPPAERVSMTRERLEQSRAVWFIVAGADKADAVRRGVGGDEFVRTPAAHVHGRSETVWLLDAAAAGELEGS